MVSSLKNLCEIPALVVISNHPDIKKEIFSFPDNLIDMQHFSHMITGNCYYDFNDWNEALQSEAFSILEDQSVPHGTIPWDLLPFIGIEMLKWARYLQTQFNLPMEFIKEFIKSSFFTSRGLLDEEKAVRELLNESSLSVFLQYEIACHYFLPDIARRLWQQFHNTHSEFQSIFIKHDSESPLVLLTKYFEETENTSISKSHLESISRDFTANVFCYGLNNGNLSAIKLIINSESRNMLEEIEESVGGDAFASAMNQLRNFFENCNSPFDMFISRDFSAHRDIVMHLVNFAKTEKERESFLLRFDFGYGLLKCCLIWPYQDLFIKTAISVFDKLSEKHFYRLMHYIVDIIKYASLNKSYNYRDLLKEFWTRSSSHHKKFTIRVESRHCSLDIYYDPYFRFVFKEGFLLQKIITLDNFSHDDEINFRLILGSAFGDAKKDILNSQGEWCVLNLIFKKKFKLADMYLDILSANEYSRKKFKKSQQDRFFSSLVYKEMCLDAAEKFVNWMVNPDEVDNLKKEIFLKAFNFSEVAHSVVFTETPVAYLNKLFEWFGKTEEETKEWKVNGVFDAELLTLLLGYSDQSLEKQCDILFEWLGYTEEKIFNVKSDILEYSFQGTLPRFFSNESPEISLYNNLLYFASNNKERVCEYVERWKTLLEVSKDRKTCIACKTNYHDRGYTNQMLDLQCSTKIQRAMVCLKNLMAISYHHR